MASKREVLLMDALEQSVALQSHYAKLLNMYDGGARIGFKNAASWLHRLRTLKQADALRRDHRLARRKPGFMRGQRSSGSSDA